MCYFENSRRLYHFKHWRATGYKVLNRVYGDHSLIVTGLSSPSYHQIWEKGVVNVSRGRFDSGGSGPGFYAYKKKRDAEEALHADEVVAKVRLRGEVSRFASRGDRRYGGWKAAGYKASKAELLKVYY